MAEPTTSRHRPQRQTPKSRSKLVTIPDSSTPKSTDAAPAPAVAKVAPEKAAEAVQPKSSATGDAPKVQGLAATGLISKTNKKKLEDAAAKGVVELDAAAQAISDKLKTVKSKNGIAIAVKDLKSQMADVQQSQPHKSADAAPAPKAGNVPVNSAGKQLISKDVVKELEEAAAQGPGELKATARGSQCQGESAFRKPGHRHRRSRPGRQAQAKAQESPDRLQGPALHRQDEGQEIGRCGAAGCRGTRGDGQCDGRPAEDSPQEDRDPERRRGPEGADSGNAKDR